MAKEKMRTLLSKEMSKEITRREFARTAALATAAAAALPRDALLTASSAAPPALACPSGDDKPKLSAAAQAEAEAKIQAIFRAYGDRLSEAQKADIRRLVREGQEPLEKLRAFSLENGDQPATALKLWPEPAYFYRSRTTWRKTRSRNAER